MHVLIAVLYILVGIEIGARPMVTSAFFTFMLAIGIILMGIVRVIMTIQHRGLNKWGWPLLVRIISMLLGLLIAARWPFSGLFMIGVYVGIELIIHGWSYIFIALAARHALDLAPSET